MIMHCLACDKLLNDYESTRKYSSSGDFVDLCNRCFSTVAEDIPDIDDGPVGEEIDEIDEGEIIGEDASLWPGFRYGEGYSQDD